ncbi:MAG: glutathione transferase GstA [Gammaproteobacteria bacterium]|nr:MAG: glutathione transferase GstA [Gammaproteobacteria bacterium]RLA23127.1 MAG: glutathione transferase GstA [Gammaproteobacteria bacterium]
MKLYYAPGACSLSPHITLCEADLPYELVKVDIQQKTIEKEGDFFKVNSYGYVPALELDNGELLIEGAAIVQYIADQVPGKKLAPIAGSIERYRLQEWLSFISTELHKGLGVLFNPALPDNARDFFKENFANRLNVLVSKLGDKSYLMGDDFTVVDAYLYTVLSWCPHVDFDLSPWPLLQAYQDRISTRDAVQKALGEEGLL